MSQPQQVSSPYHRPAQSPTRSSTPGPTGRTTTRFSFSTRHLTNPNILLVIILSFGPFFILSNFVNISSSINLFNYQNDEHDDIVHDFFQLLNSDNNDLVVDNNVDDDDSNDNSSEKDEEGGGEDDFDDKINPNENDNDQVDTPQNPQTQPLNILILYPDDWRHDSIGAEKPYVLTPFLNQLSNEGIRFRQNAVTTSVCWMSRATLFTGQYSSRHKSYKLACPWFTLPEHWKHSWIKILQNLYNTTTSGTIGKNYFIGHVGKWQYWTPKTEKLFNWSSLFEGHHWETRNGRTYSASDYTRIRAINFLNTRPKDQPFVLTVAFYPPKPVADSSIPGEQWKPTNETKKLYENVTIPRPEYNESFSKLPDFLKDERHAAVHRYQTRYRTEEQFQASMKNYYALVTGVDQACKGIVDKLKQDGLYNNTMIIFTTDNGMFHGSHGLAGKWYPYQESIRVPLIIYDPRMPKEKIGTLDDSFTLNVDLAKTILGAAGVKPDNQMMGRDISDLYLPNNIKNKYHDSASVDKESWRDEFFYEFPSPDPGIPPSTALVRKEWKYIHWFNHDREQLFHLKEDPLELNDLYQDKKYESVLTEMRERHDELKKDLFDQSYKNFGKCNTFLEDYDEVYKSMSQARN
jgi:arylsulfatase